MSQETTLETLSDTTEDFRLISLSQCLLETSMILHQLSVIGDLRDQERQALYGKMLHLQRTFSYILEKDGLTVSTVNLSHSSTTSETTKSVLVCSSNCWTGTRCWCRIKAASLIGALKRYTLQAIGTLIRGS